MIHGHGDEYVGGLVANFSSNVWWGADNSDLYQHLSANFTVVERYPEPDAASLAHQIALRKNISPTNVVVTNGSTEAFYIIAHAFAGRKSLVVVPTFSEYADACRMHQHTLRFTSRNELEESIVGFMPDVVWICNPNNPDGHCFAAVALQLLLERFSAVCFVVDQAYADMCLCETMSAKEIFRYPNLLLVESMTKKYAIPGLRLGYLMADEMLMAEINRIRLPWSVNALAIEAGKYILSCTGEMTFPLDEWLMSAEKLRKEVDGMTIFETIPSSTPFFLTRLTVGRAAELKEFLLENHLLIRQATNYEGLEGEYIRICALSEDKNSLLLKKLEEWSRNITR